MIAKKRVAMAVAVALPLSCISFVSMMGMAEAAASGGAVAQSTARRTDALRQMYMARRKPSVGDAAAVSPDRSKVKRPRRSDRTPKRPSSRRRSARGSSQPSEKVAEYRTLVNRFAREYGVPADLAHAVVLVESNYFPNAKGSAGEVGLMQIKPSTARIMGYRGSVSGLFHPETNLRFGMKYLAKAYQLGKTTCGTILRYNAGHGAKCMNPVSSAYCEKVKRILGGKSR